MALITWKTTINIITKLFEVTQATVAERLNISTSTLSKIKTGSRAPAFTSDELYEKLFDPEKKDSLTKDTANFHLGVVKAVIEESFPQVKEELADCWETGDYREFVLCLLNRTRKDLTVTDNAATDGKANDLTNGAETDADALDEHRPTSSIVISLVDDESEPVSVAHDGIFDFIVPKKDRICATCGKWKGDVEEAMRTRDGVYGICKIYNNRSQLSIEGGNCVRYTPNSTRISLKRTFEKNTI